MIPHRAIPIYTNPLYRYAVAPCGFRAQRKRVSGMWYNNARTQAGAIRKKIRQHAATCPVCQTHWKEADNGQ